MVNSANPYAPPTAAAEALPPVSADGFVYEPTPSLNLALLVLLGATSLAFVVGAWSLFDQADLLQRAKSGAVISIAEANANDSRVSLIAGIWLLLFLSTVVVWCVWQNRTSKNVRALGAVYMQYGPNAWGWFFCPFINLWRPMQVIGELWNAAAIDAPGKQLWRQPEPPSAVVGIWWLCFIVGNMISRFADRNLEKENDLDALITGSQWLGVAWSVLAVSGVFAIIYLAMLQERVEQRAASRTA
jgi:hypothetical protein